MNTQMLTQLTQPFAPKHMTWKPGSTTKDGSKCMALAYADFRAYMDRLDEVCGVDWSCRYVPWEGGKIICELTIGGVTRSSTGEPDPQDEKNNLAGPVAEAQAFKRAATMFGLGRYLYDLPTVWVEFDSQHRRISEGGRKDLEARYITWYQKTMARKVDSSTGEILSPAAALATTVVNPFTDEVEFANVKPKAKPATKEAPAQPAYTYLWQKMSGPEYDLIDWCQQMHRKGGPCSPQQYQFLTGIMDDLTGDNHNYILSLLCQADISHENVPSKQAAHNLLNYLNPKDNPNFDPGIAARVRALGTAVPIPA